MTTTNGCGLQPPDTFLYRHQHQLVQYSLKRKLTKIMGSFTITEKAPTIRANFMSTYRGVNVCFVLCLDSVSVFNVKALVGAFNQENALVGAFPVIVKCIIFSNLQFKLYCPVSSFSVVMVACDCPPRYHLHYCSLIGVIKSAVDTGHAFTNETTIFRNRILGNLVCATLYDLIFDKW